MIQLTRLNHVPLIVNSDLIEHVEVTPDTVIALTTGQKFLVLESAEDVIERVIRFRKAIVSENGCPLRKDGQLVHDHSGSPESSTAGPRE